MNNSKWMIQHLHEETLEIGSDYPNWTFVLAISDDDFCSPEDDDGLTAKQRKAWADDEWRYVSVTVYAIANDLILGEASYGGIEYGWFTVTDEHDNLIEKKDITLKDLDNYVGSELAGEAQSQALETLKELSKLLEEK